MVIIETFWSVFLLWSMKTLLIKKGDTVRLKVVHYVWAAKKEAVPREVSFTLIDPDTKSTCTHTLPLSSLSVCYSYLLPVCTGFHEQIIISSFMLSKYAPQEQQRQQFGAEWWQGYCEDSLRVWVSVLQPGGHVRPARVKKSVWNRNWEPHDNDNMAGTSGLWAVGYNCHLAASVYIAQPVRQSHRHTSELRDAESLKSAWFRLIILQTQSWRHWWFWPLRCCLVSHVCCFQSSFSSPSIVWSKC